MTNHFNKLYHGDYSEEGYHQGIEDAKQHKSKNKFTFFKAVNPVNLLWNTDNAYDSFTQSYNSGYLDGQRVSHGVYGSLQSTGGNMQAIDHYANHLRMLDEVKTVIQSLRKHLDGLDEQYQHQVQQAEQVGIMQNYTAVLEQKRRYFSAKIEALSQMIERHENKIEQQQDIIQGLKEKSQQTV